MKKRIFAAVLMVFALSLIPFLKANAQVQDHLNVPGPVFFLKSDYQLAWSSHPNATYYKQEYLKAGEKPESFKEMVLIEFLEGNFTAKDLVALKVKELNERKKTGAVANYEVIESPDGSEYIIDFILSKGAAENLEFVEWNAYRYKQIKERSGKTGVMLMAISRRAYGEDITDFLQNLGSSRTAYRNELSSFKLPEINLTKSKQIR